MIQLCVIFALFLPSFPPPDAAFVPVPPSTHPPADDSDVTLRNTYERPPVPMQLPFTRLCHSNATAHDGVVTSDSFYSDTYERGPSTDESDASLYSSYSSNNNNDVMRSSFNKHSSGGGREPAESGQREAGADSIEITYNPAFSPIYEDSPALALRDVTARTDVTNMYGTRADDREALDYLGR